LSAVNRVYAEPLASYWLRKYFELVLATLPAVGAGLADLALLTSKASIWVWVYANAGGALLSSVAWYVYRNRLRRRRFRIHEGRVCLPSLARIDGDVAEDLDVTSIMGVGARRERYRLGWHTGNPITEVELRIRSQGQQQVLVWPVGGFGLRNFRALEAFLASSPHPVTWMGE